MGQIETQLVAKHAPCSGPSSIALGGSLRENMLHQIKIGLHVKTGGASTSETVGEVPIYNRVLPWLQWDEADNVNVLRVTRCRVAYFSLVLSAFKRNGASGLLI